MPAPDPFVVRSRERRLLALEAGRSAVAQSVTPLELRELPDTAPMAPAFELWSCGASAHAVVLVFAHAGGTSLVAPDSGFAVGLDDPADPDRPELVEPLALEAALALFTELGLQGLPREPSSVVMVEERPGDRSGIDALHRAAFARDDETLLVNALRTSSSWMGELSLVALDDDNRVAGHVLLTRAQVDETEVLALAPIAVLPELQGRGIGEHLVSYALVLAAGLGHHTVAVLGDPAFYARFGFRSARSFGILPPAHWPEEAFQVLGLSRRPLPQGTMRYPEPFGV